jgi:hypothetical protein
MNEEERSATAIEKKEIPLVWTAPERTRSATTPERTLLDKLRDDTGSGTHLVWTGSRPRARIV